MSFDSSNASPHPALAAGARLADVATAAAVCDLCKLAAGRTQVVFGVGRPDADLMFVGEGPGEQEDLKGEPFVGRAGQLLTQLIEGIGLTRDDVYIANVVKCRPPGNRDPQPDEIEACAPWLDRQLELIRPRVIVTLGNFATKFVLKTQVGITRLHGTVQHTGRFTVLPIYHPAAAIYDRTKHDDLVADFERLARVLAEEQPGDRAHLGEEPLAEGTCEPADAVSEGLATQADEVTGSADLPPVGDQQRLF